MAMAASAPPMSSAPPRRETRGPAVAAGAKAVGASAPSSARRRPRRRRRSACGDGAFGRQLGEAVAGERLELAGDAVRPHAPGRRAVDEGARGDGLLGLPLAQQPVGDLVAALGGQAARTRAQRVEGVVGARADLVGIEAQQAGEVVVALALAQQQLQDGLLVGGKGVETAHGGWGG